MTTRNLGTEFERQVGNSALDAVREVVQVRLTPAQILALHTTPVQVVAAPGPNHAVLIERVIAEVPFNSAAYAGIAAGEDLQFRYTNAAGGQVFEIETTGLLDVTADVKAYKLFTARQINVTNNAPIVVRLPGAVTSGDSELHLSIYVRRVPMAP